MDETNPYINAVYGDPSLFTTGYAFTDKTKGDTYDPEVEKQSALNFRLRINNQDYFFVPRSVLEKGTKVKDEIVVYPGVLAPDFEQKFAPYSQPYTAKQIYDTLYNYSTAVDPRENQFLKDIKEYGYKEDDVGYLVPGSFFNDFKPEVIPSTAAGTKHGTVNVNNIAGIGTKDGQKVFVIDTAGSTGPNPQGYYDYNPATGGLGQGAVSTYKEPASWVKAANVVGWTLIGLGTAGMAGFGPLAGGGATAGATTGATAGATAGATTGATASGLGTGITAGAGGATGLTAGATATGIGGGALGTGLVAPSGFVLAPGVGATLGAATVGTGLLDTARFPTAAEGMGGGTGITPGAAGQGLQVPTTPGLSSMGGAQGLTVPVAGGTVSQLGFVPTGATPVLGDPASFINNPDVLGNTVFTTDKLTPPGAATSGMSATDALRALNEANKLLNPAGQNPLVPQQQGLPGRAAGTVDYSGILALLQRQATTPGVSSLLAPAQLKQMYQPLLTPSTLSLLG